MIIKWCKNYFVRALQNKHIVWNNIVGLNKKQNKISKKVLTARKIGDKVLLVFEKQDKTQEAEKRKRENF